MDYIAIVHGAQISCLDGRDGDGVATEGEELDLEGFTILVGVDDGAAIAAGEAVGGQVGEQNYAVEFFHQRE